MKKLSLFLLALLLAFPAHAGWVLRQDADGGAYWVDTDDGEEIHVTEGRIMVRLPDVSSPTSTAYIIAPVKGTIEKIYSVLQGTISSANSKITFGIGDGLGAFTEVTNGTGKMTIASSSTGGTVDTFTPTGSNTIEEGEVIEIYTDGGSSTSAAIDFMIWINPK